MTLQIEEMRQMTICLGHGYIANFPSGTNKETEAKLDNVEFQTTNNNINMITFE